jgi:hypothetical protein
VPTAFMNWSSLLVGTIDSRSSDSDSGLDIEHRTILPTSTNSRLGSSGLPSTFLMCRHHEGWEIRVAFCPAAIKRRRVWGIQGCICLDAFS